MITFFYSEKEEKDKKEVMSVLTPHGWKKFTSMKKEEAYTLPGYPDAKIVFMTINDSDPFIKNSQGSVNFDVLKFKLKWHPGLGCVLESDPVYLITREKKYEKVVFKIIRNYRDIQNHKDLKSNYKGIIKSIKTKNGKSIVEKTIVSENDLESAIKKCDMFSNQFCIEKIDEKTKKTMKVDEMLETLDFDDSIDNEVSFQGFPVIHTRHMLFSPMFLDNLPSFISNGSMEDVNQLFSMLFGENDSDDSDSEDDSEDDSREDDE